MIILYIVTDQGSSRSQCFDARSVKGLSLMFSYGLGSLSNDDGDGNKNVKKEIGLYWQNNNFARASRFLVHFFAVTALLRRENAYFHVLSGAPNEDIVQKHLT